MRRWGWVTTTIMLIMVIAAGCSVDSGTDPEDPIQIRDSPENLLKFFADAYERKDIDKYAESLHDEYLFTFTSKDAELIGLPEDEPWWGKTEDRVSTLNMFEDAEVTSILMDLPISSGPWATEEGLGYRLEPSIKVTVDDPEATEPTTYWVFSSWFDIEVVVDPYDEELWVFKEIAEINKEGVLASAATGE